LNRVAKTTWIARETRNNRAKNKRRKWRRAEKRIERTGRATRGRRPTPVGKHGRRRSQICGENDGRQAGGGAGCGGFRRVSEDRWTRRRGPWRETAAAGCGAFPSLLPAVSLCEMGRESCTQREVAERLSCEKAAVCVILQPLLPFHRDAFCTPAASSWYSQG
jgi:hypothetical protein